MSDPVATKTASSMHKKSVNHIYRPDPSQSKERLGFDFTIQAGKRGFAFHFQVNSSVMSGGKAIVPNSAYHIFFCVLAIYDTKEDQSEENLKKFALETAANEVLREVHKGYQALLSDIGVDPNEIGSKLQKLPREINSTTIEMLDNRGDLTFNYSG